MSLTISNFYLKINSKFTQINYFHYKTNEIWFNSSQVFDLMKNLKLTVNLQSQHYSAKFVWNC